jgi:hypothetical protein
MADKTQNTKEPISRQEKIVKPIGEKPKGFKTVYFKYRGQNKRMQNKTFVSYVTPEVAEAYQKRIGRNKSNVLKVE